MVYTNVTEATAYPSEVLNINFSSGSPVTTNAWVRFTNIVRRFREFPQYLYSPSAPSTLYSTSFDANNFTFPTITTLRWNVENQSDFMLSLYLRNTGDPYINVIPTRIVPTLTVISEYEIHGSLNQYEQYVLTTTDSPTDEDLLDAYITSTTPTTLDIDYIMGGPAHLKKRIVNSNLVFLGSSVSTASGTFGKKIIGVGFTVDLKIGADIVTFSVTPSPATPTNLITKLTPEQIGTYSTTAVTGTINYDTGAWTLTFTAGNSAPNSYISASYLIHETDVPMTYTSGGTDPTFTIVEDYPIYLYDIDLQYSSDAGVNYFYACSIGFNAYADIVNNYSSEISVYPKFQDYYKSAVVDVNGTHSKWRLYSAVDVYDLSAIDGDGLPYNINSWIDGDNSPIRLNTNDDSFQNYSMVLEISSTNGLIKSHNVEFYTNTANLFLTLSALHEFENKVDYGFTIDSGIEFDPDSLIYFDIFPNLNGTTLSRVDGTPILLNTGYGYQDVARLSALNVGIGTTTISLTSDFIPGLEGAYAITSSLPLSVYDLKFSITRDPACDMADVFDAYAYFEKDNNGIKYVPPVDGKLCWNITSPQSFTLTAINREDTQIFLNSCVPSIHNDLLKLKFRVGPPGIVARGGDVTFNLSFEGLDGVDASASPKTIKIQNIPTPTVYDSFFNVLSGGSVLCNSKTTTNYPLVTGVYELEFEIDDLPFAYSEDNVRWIIDGVETIGDASITQIISATDSDTICAELFITDVTLAGWTSPFCFTDKICFNFVGNNSVDFIAFPKNRYSGATKTIQDFTNFSNSYGNTAYNCGHTEIFYLSAEPGYDQYDWQVGNSRTSSQTNTTTLGVRGVINDVNTLQTIYVSAYDYTISTNIPFIGFSDNSHPLKEDVLFYDYFGYENISSITKDTFNLNDYSTIPFLLNLNFAQLTASPVSIVPGSNVTICLSGSSGSSYLEIPITGNSTTKLFNFSTNSSDFFKIRPNSFNTLNVCISANLALRIKDALDFSIRPFDTNLLCIPITAYNGPFLSISTESNCVSSGQYVLFKNTTPTFLGFEYSDFTFDDGNGNIMSADTTSEWLTGFYNESGTYTPKLSGILNGNLTIKQFKNFIIADCGTGCQEYDSSMTRTFPDDLRFPYDLKNILKANERLTHWSINDALTKAYENFQYLIDNSKAYSIDVPTLVVNTIEYEGIGSGLLSWKKRDSLYFSIATNNTIKITNVENLYDESLDYDSRIDIVKNDNVLTEGELLQTPSSMDVGPNGDYYIIVDSKTKSVYVFDFDKTKNKSKLKTYWGGPGSRSSRTKFNSPNGVIIGPDESVYISDSKSYIIKKYNKNYNWIKNIFHKDWTINNSIIISMDVDLDNNLYVLCNDKIIYVFSESGDFSKKFSIIETGKVFVNKAFPGICYVINGKNIIKYTTDGIKINKWIRPEFDSAIIDIEQTGGLLTILTTNKVYTIFDCVKVDYLRDETLDLNFWPYSSLEMHKDEFINDWNYNDSFFKLFQNLNMFQKTIINKFVTYVDPDDSSRIIHSFVPITSDEFILCDSELSPIGVNEFVSYEVLNRSFTQLQKCMDSLLTTIKSRPRTVEDCGGPCFTWKKLTTGNSIQPNICESNPMSWVELENYGVTDWYDLTCQNCSATELERLEFVLSAAENRVPSSIDKCDFSSK
jgi:hypothetical protein